MSKPLILPSVFSSNMVLQRDVPLPVWGWGEPGCKVAVTIDRQSIDTTAGPDGAWRVTLDPMKAGGPLEMTIRAGEEVRTLANIAVGDVWLCSGQSNMEMTLQLSRSGADEVAAADHPGIRLTTIPRSIAVRPLARTDGWWEVCAPQFASGFSGVGYFFGRALHKELGVPIGLINASWGGSCAEAWTPIEALRADPDLAPILRRREQMLAEREKAYDNYLEALTPEGIAKLRAEVARARAEGVAPAPLLAPSAVLGDFTLPCCLFNAIINPLIPFAIRGAIWYQGESNVDRAYQYRQLFPAVIQGWRDAWGQDDFAFLWVQLANYMASAQDPGESTWAELREAQSMALSLPNTGEAVAIDVGEANDIHPTNKQDVGLRLSLAARAVSYGQRIVHSGPVYRSMTIEDDHVKVHFDHVGGGLVARGGGPLKGFAVAGRDRRFVWAEAQVVRDAVVVSSPSVARPAAVRYGWADNPVCNLHNAEGLPACPFRTDDWPGITEGNV